MALKINNRLQYITCCRFFDFLKHTYLTSLGTRPLWCKVFNFHMCSYSNIWVTPLNIKIYQFLHEFIVIDEFGGVIILNRCYYCSKILLQSKPASSVCFESTKAVRRSTTKAAENFLTTTACFKANWAKFLDVPIEWHRSSNFQAKNLTIFDNTNEILGVIQIQCTPVAWVSTTACRSDFKFLGD